MTRNPVACDVNDSVEVAAKHMRDKNIGSVVVLQNGKVAGIVTDRQLTTQVLADGKGNDVKVSDVMTKNPATLHLDDNIFSAIDTMRSAGVARRIPVVTQENELVGILSISDLAIIGKDIIDGVLLEQTHHALEEAHILTGAKAFVKQMRRPTKLDKLPPQQDIRTVTEPTPEGVPPKSGGAQQQWGGGGEQQTPRQS